MAVGGVEDTAVFDFNPPPDAGVVWEDDEGVRAMRGAA
jgi:hypothetical protein